VGGPSASDAARPPPFLHDALSGFHPQRASEPPK
jgi:hypothetical protein